METHSRSSDGVSSTRSVTLSGQITGVGASCGQLSRQYARACGSDQAFHSAVGVVLPG